MALTYTAPLHTLNQQTGPAAANIPGYCGGCTEDGAHPVNHDSPQPTPSK